METRTKMHSLNKTENKDSNGDIVQRDQTDVGT